MPRFFKLCALALALSGARPDVALAEAKSFDSFADVRGALLNAIGSATKRIWLTTDYLTDGEIVSALYVAQYRKLDVTVLLGRAKANFYMSRLNYLKNQNIPVFLRPDTFKPQRSTTILADDKLYELDGELDFMSKYKHYTLTTSDGAAAQAFATAFANAANLKVPAVARAVPLVGRPRAGNYGKAYVPSALPVPTYNTHDGSGAYTYDRKVIPRPNGVPAKLPKDLKWERQKHPMPAKAAPIQETPGPAAQPAPAAPALPGDSDTLIDHGLDNGPE